MNNTNTKKCNHMGLLYKLLVLIFIVNHLTIVYFVVVLVIIIAVAVVVDPE